jgi:excisionase family DNA binding protein
MARTPMSQAAISARQLAKMLGVSLRHVRRMIASGQLNLRTIRIGRCVRFPLHGPGGVHEWLESDDSSSPVGESRKKN